MPDLGFVDWLASEVEFQFVLAAAHPKDFKPVYFGDEARRSLDGLLRVVLQKHMREARAEVRAVDVQLLLARDVHVLTPRAVDLDAGRRQFLTHSDGKHILAFAKDSWAGPKTPKHKLFFHHCKASR